MEMQPPNNPGNLIPKPAVGPDRPGCVTAYALLLFAAAGLITLTGLLAGFQRLKNAPATGVLYILGGLLIGLLYFFLGRGFMQMKNWARITILVLQSLGVLVGLGELCLVFTLTRSEILTSSNLGILAGFIVSGIVIYWFASHGNLFE